VRVLVGQVYSFLYHREGKISGNFARCKGRAMGLEKGVPLHIPALLEHEKVRIAFFSGKTG